MTGGPHCAVVGGQFGSEGKGLIVGYVAHRYQRHVRVGAANAGHTLYKLSDGAWEKHVMQQIPCAAYANPDAELLIGPGAQISPEIYADELSRLVQWRINRGWHARPPLRIDPRAHVITQTMIDREAATDLQDRIGSTSTTAREGIGSAQAARVMRESGCVLAGDYYEDKWLVDVPEELVRNPLPTLLEGTQGYGLSLTTGEFPYVTSRNTTFAGLCADVGVAPHSVGRVILVARTYPIRVAGNSGPFHPGSDEIDWSTIGIDPETERTTVTKKIRRVATFSVAQIAEAAHVNGATEIALTFCDYVDRRLAGQCGQIWTLGAYPQVQELVNDIEGHTGTPVTMLGTGPHSVIELDSDHVGRR